MNITNISKANGKDAVDISNFTKDQLNAYESLIEFINSPYDINDYKRALVGPAGTGKTYLVKALIKNSNLSYSAIGLSAPTHKACRVLNESLKISNIHINTLQSDLGFRLNFNVDNFDIKNPPFDSKGKIKISNYRLYIIDEASMLNRDITLFIEKICKSNKCKLLYIGDSYQLGPINEKYSPAFKAIKTNELKQIIRQGEDNPISYLLELLRYDIKNKTYSFINHILNNKYKFNSDNTKGYAVLNETEFNAVVLTNFTDEELVSNIDFVKIIAYTNNAVSNWNKFVRNIIIKDSDKSVITKNDLIISYNTLVDVFNTPIIKNSEEYILKDVVNYVHPTYELKGFMVRFTAIHGGSNTTPLFIIDHKDKFTIANYVRISNNLINAAVNASNSIKSQKWKEYYKFKESCLILTNIIDPNTGKIIFNRDLDYGFSLTTHKSQGSTFDTVLVDLSNIIFDKFGNPYTDVEEVNRRLYVACSRCKNKLYLRYAQSR